MKLGSHWGESLAKGSRFKGYEGILAAEGLPGHRAVCGYQTHSSEEFEPTRTEQLETTDKNGLGAG